MGSRATPVLATTPPHPPHGQTQAGSSSFLLPPPPEQQTPGPKRWKINAAIFDFLWRRRSVIRKSSGDIGTAAAYDVTRERRRRRRDEPEDDEEDDEEGGKSRKGSTCIPLPPTHPPERAARPPAGAELREEEICLDGRDSWHRGALDLLGRSFYGTLLLLVRVFADTPLVDLASLHTPS